MRIGIDLPSGLMDVQGSDGVIKRYQLSDDELNDVMMGVFKAWHRNSADLMSDQKEAIKDIKDKQKTKKVKDEDDDEEEVIYEDEDE